MGEIAQNGMNAVPAIVGTVAMLYVILEMAFNLSTRLFTPLCHKRHKTEWKGYRYTSSITENSGYYCPTCETHYEISEAPNFITKKLKRGRLRLEDLGGVPAE